MGMPAEEKEKVAEQVGEALEENFKNLEKKSSPSKGAKDGDAKDKAADGVEPMEDGDKKGASPSKDKDAKKSPAKEKDDSAMDTDSKEDKDESQDEDESQEEG